MSDGDARNLRGPPQFAGVSVCRLAGKSRDQINREIKTGKLLTLSMGNRGQRIPDWQFDPAKSRLVHAVLKQVKGMDSWLLYRVLLQPEAFVGRCAIEAGSSRYS